MDLNNLNNNNIGRQEDERIDIKIVFFKYLNNWKLFLLSFIIFLSLAFIYNRYTVPTYSVSSTLLIRDDNNTQLGAENLIEGLELFSGKKNLKNEIVILNSFSLNHDVVNELKLGISYKQHSSIVTNDLYKNSPFIVVLDSNHLQTSGTDFILNLIDNESFRIEAKENNIFAYDIIDKKNVKDRTYNIDIDKIYKFGQKIKGECFSFKIQKSNKFFKNFDKEKSYSFRVHNINKLTQKYINKVNINPVNKEASVLKINFKNTNPKKHIDFINKLTELYIKTGLDEKNLMATNTISFIDKQLIFIKDSLNQIELDIENFISRNPEIKIAEKDFGTFFQKQKIDNTLNEHIVHIKYYKSLLSYLKEENETNDLISPSSIGISNPEINLLINQLINLLNKRKELSFVTTPKNQIFISVNQQIQNTKQILIENVDNLIRSSEIYEKELRSQLENFTKNIDNLPQAEKDFLILTRKQQINEETVKYLQTKRYEASLAKAGTNSDHKIIDSARLDSDIPLTPNKNLIYFISIFLSFVSPITFLFIKNFFNNSIQSKSDITKRTDVPILALIGNSINSSNISLENSRSLLSESFRSLRTNIQYLSSEKKKKIISVTSTKGGEGKTFCSVNLATILAISGKKIILIGADLRKPKLHKDFSIKNNIGLSNLLIDKIELDKAIYNTEVKNLDLILSGPIPPNPSELLDGQKMNKIIKELEKKYDYIIIDTPPVGLVTDALVLMKYTDINLYILRHNYSDFGSFSIINKLKNNENVKNLNLIINDYNFENKKYGYSYGDDYGFGYSYGYYNKYEENN